MNRSTATVTAAAPRAWRLPALLLMLAAWLVYHTLSARLPVAQWRTSRISFFAPCRCRSSTLLAVSFRLLSSRLCTFTRPICSGNIFGSRPNPVAAE